MEQPDSRKPDLHVVLWWTLVQQSMHGLVVTWVRCVNSTRVQPTFEALTPARPPTVEHLLLLLMCRLVISTLEPTWQSAGSTG